MPRSFSHLPAHAPGTSGQPLASLPSHRSLLGDDDLDSLLAPVISPGAGVTPLIPFYTVPHSLKVMKVTWNGRPS